METYGPAMLLLLLALPLVRSEEPVPSRLLSPRNFNHHPYDAVQFLKSVKPTKQGPVLFPNDGPNPPPTPLVVTSRPLLESIARSELGEQLNNSIASQSQVAQVTFRPQLAQVTFRPLAQVTGGYLARVKDYKPFTFSVPSPTPAYDYGSSEDQYPEVKQKLGADTRYDYYEEKPTLPPIYKALSNHAQSQLNKHTKSEPYQYQAKTPDYDYYQNNKVGEESKDYNQGENYAFSYRVNDRQTGDDFSHSQSSSGSATNGEYRVRLPDGRMQIVSYTADENGYKADVRYDEDHKKENRIDVETNKQNQYLDYSDNRYKTDNTNRHLKDDFKSSRENYRYIQAGLLLPKPTPTADIIHINNQANANKGSDYLDQYNEKQAPYYSINKNNNNYLDISKSVKVNNNHDNIHTNFNPNIQNNYDYHYNDDVNSFSKEYKDYSSELAADYQPHRSKFSIYTANGDSVAKSTVRPAYEDIKHLFVTFKNRLNSPTPILSTVSPTYDTTTEHVVIIGAKKPQLFTNIKDSIPVTPSPLTYTTPGGYLVSTITNLKNKISLTNKPVLSNNFIDKINQYLTYK